MFINAGPVLPLVFGGGMSANVTETNVTLQGGTATYVFGGSNVNGIVATSNLITTSGTVTHLFGGNNRDGTTETSNVITNGGTAVNVYGGNDQGGTTITSNVTINSGNITNVYGGGNQAEHTVTYVNINGPVLNEVYGGGNFAEVTSDTNLNLNANAIINGNVYGGGNQGEVLGNTYVNVKDANLKSSVYAGGNGATAIVQGNTNLNIDGSVTLIEKNAFGGGNRAATGIIQNDNSISTVNIVGGEIRENVYGGANTSVVNGVTDINIGIDTINDPVLRSNLEAGDVKIGGTVFGGGEANEEGSESYDFSFTSVTRGIDIDIDGNGHNVFYINGSIFGSGNASSTAGPSVVNIKNYGISSAPITNTSIQRADIVTLDNSVMVLNGAKDTTNDYSSTFFSISRVDEFKLKNNSILYLNYSTNLLKKFSSLVDINDVETKATVAIDPDTGAVTKNVDNRLYIIEGKNINIALNQQNNVYGEVYGMTFFGLFTNNLSPHTSTGLYNESYDDEDQITNAGTFVANGYVSGRHNAGTHDITADGFYSNYNEEGVIDVRYIEPTPENDVYYLWLVGEALEVTTFPVTLTASKYATLGTYELVLMGFGEPNTRFVLSGFSAGLEAGNTLVSPNDIDEIAPTDTIANSQFGLTIETGKNSWQTDNLTEFYTVNGGSYSGDTYYISDNSTYTPSLNLCFFHSKNLSEQKDVGTVRVRYQALVPNTALSYDISYIDIVITLNTNMFPNDSYEAAISPGKEYGLFTSTETSITSNSSFSSYFSLYIPEFSTSQYYINQNVFRRVLVSTDSNGLPYVFTDGTKITMIDLTDNKYYYYVVTAADVQNNKTIYPLDEFLEMGTNNKYYDESVVNNMYYNNVQDIFNESYIFQVDVSDSAVSSTVIDNALLMELRTDTNQTLIGVLGWQRNFIKYSIYVDNDAEINVTAELTENRIYLGNETDLVVSTEYMQNIVNTKTIYDTYYFDKKMGIKLTIYDINGNQLNSDSLLGVNFVLEGITYYPRIDGTVRMCIADRVSNVLSRIKINTSGNKSLATGTYTIKVESFGSPDGIYFGLVPSSFTEIDLDIINMQYGLKVTTAEAHKTINKTTGKFSNNNNSMFLNIFYTSQLADPNLRLALYRKDYSSIFNTNYNLVNLADYITQELPTTSEQYEYEISTQPINNFISYLTFKENLVTGTYRFALKLYDGDNYIGEVYEYIVIK